MKVESPAYETLKVRSEDGVLFAEIAAPPMNLLGPDVVRDLVSLILEAEADDASQVLVFTSADSEYFISHVDVARIGEYREAAAKLAGEASLGLLLRRVSTSRLVTIAQIEGRVRAAGSEFVLACDRSLHDRNERLPLLDDIGGELGAVGGSDILHRVDDSIRDC